MTVEVQNPCGRGRPGVPTRSGDIRSPDKDVAGPKSHGYSEHLDSYGASEAGSRDDRYPFARRWAGDVSEQPHYRTPVVVSRSVWKKRSGAFFRLVKCTTSRPPGRAATGGTRHGPEYQEAGRSA